MNRIDKKFAELRAQGKKALLTLVTGGDPSLDMTHDLILEMEHNGVDLIEIGIPFSDPIAEGPVIQAANIRALQGGVNLSKIMEMVHRVRTKTEIPLLYWMYFNSILHYGIERFFAECAEVGIDGVIIPDLPYEESGEIFDYTEKYGVYQISLIAPNSDADMERVKLICKEAKGFLYCASSLGVTGIRSEFHTNFSEMFRELNQITDLPKCIGFGISKPEHIVQMKDYCDGLIVGSAVVRQIESGATPGEKLEQAGSFIKSLKSAF